MSPAAEEQSLPESGSFVERVVKLPVVHSALTYATNGYDHLKNKNDLANYTLTLVENSLWYTAEQAKPVLQKLEKPINVADHMACNGLTVLENKIPLLNKPPEEIIDTTKKMYESAISAGFSSYEGVKKMSIDKIQNLAELGVSKVQTFVDEACVTLMTSTEAAITTTEDYVDYYLPPSEDETKMSTNEENEKDFAGRMETLSNKTRDRMYRMAVKRLNYLQKRSEETLENVRKATELIKNAKADEAKTAVSGAITTVQDKATWLWKELNKEEEMGTMPKTTEQQLLFLARRATKQLVQTYTTYSASLQNLPHTLQERLVSSRQGALDIYNHFTQVSTLKEISATVLSKVQEKLAYLQHTANVVFEYLSTTNLEDILRVKSSDKPEEIEMTVRKQTTSS